MNYHSGELTHISLDPDKLQPSYESVEDMEKSICNAAKRATVYIPESKTSAFLRQEREGLRLFLSIMAGLLIIFVFSVTAGNVELQIIQEALGNPVSYAQIFLPSTIIAAGAYISDCILKSGSIEHEKEHPLWEALGYAAGWFLGWLLCLVNISNIATLSFPVLTFFVCGIVATVFLVLLGDFLESFTSHAKTNRKEHKENSQEADF